MPRATGAPGRELDAAHVGARPLRKRQTSWKQPLAEAATRCEPLKSVAARLARLGGDRNALWLTVTEGPERTPLDDLEFRINARIWLGLSVVRGGQCQHQKRQKSDGTAGAKSLAHLDDHGQHAQKCLCGGDRAKLHDADCHTIHNACCEAGPTSKREVSVPTLATEKLTEPRVEVDAPHHPQRLLRSRALTWMHGGHRTFDSTSQSSTRKLFTTRQRCEKDKKKHRLRHRRSERKRTNTGKRKEELESPASLCSSVDGLAQG